MRGTAAAEPYTYPLAVRGPKPRFPERDRRGHAAALERQIAAAESALASVAADRAVLGLPVESGLQITFESADGFELILESLERERDGITLDNVVERDKRTWATVTVQPGRLAKLVALIHAYAHRDTATGKPKNAKLVSSIESIHRAVLDSLWTDEQDARPNDDAMRWFELWIRASPRQREADVAAFRAHAAALDIHLSDGALYFPDRAVLLAFCTLSAVALSVRLLDVIAEVRLAKELARFFARDLPSHAQPEWVDAYLARLTPPARAEVAVCILDTGVNREHPLLRASLEARDVLTCHPDWHATDHHGHGTEMAGLALHGDLAEALTRVESTAIDHALESVKLVAPAHLQPQAPTLPIEERKALWGSLTREATARIELERPERPRVF